MFDGIQRTFRRLARPNHHHHQQQQQQQQQQQPPPSPSRALVGMDPYSITPQERSRYETLFPQYAKTEADGQQFVYGAEAVPLFMRSGVDPNDLRDIWNMVDRNPVDNRLDRLEFTLAMHLIVCVSKKNLPLPPGGTLPGSLQALKVAGGSSTGAAAGTGAPSTPAPPQAMQGAEMGASMGTSMGMSAGGPPPLGGPGSGALGGVSISDAFEGMSTEPTPTPPQALPSYVPETTVVEPQQQQQQPSYSHAPEPQQQQQAPPPVVVAKPPTPQVQPSYVHVPQQMQSAPSVAGVSSASVGTYEVSNSHMEELEKLKDALQKLRAENVSLKSQLGTMTEEEKQVQQELGQTVTEITALSADLGAQRQQVLEAKNRLLEAKAELKSQKDTKDVLTELISEANQTKDAIESATETIQAAGAAAATASPPVNYNNQVAESVDLFDMGEPMTPGIERSGFQNEFGAGNTTGGFTGGMASVPSSTPAEQQQQAPVEDTSANSPGTPTYQQPPVEHYQQPPEAGGPPPTPTMHSNYAAVPTPAPYPAASPMPERSPVPQRSQQKQPRQHPTPTNTNRPALANMHQSSGFDSGFLMGGQAEMISQDADADNFSVAAHSIASTGGYGYDDETFEIVEGMKKKAKRADGAARDAERASSKLSAEASELRSDADRAEANYRSLVAAFEEKKKGRFGGGKKKKMKEGAEQAGKDATEIKQHFEKVQARALEAATVAAQTRSEADRLRDEAEAAELQMVAAASAQQKQPALSSAPPKTSTNGYGASPKPDYGGKMPAPQQSDMPQYGQMMPMPPASNPVEEYNNNYINGNTGGAGDAYGDVYAQSYGQAPPVSGGDAYAQPYGQAPPVNPYQTAPGLPLPPPMSLPNPSLSAPGVMGNGGGYDMPSPAAFQQMAPPTGASVADPYANPF